MTNTRPLFGRRYVLNRRLRECLFSMEAWTTSLLLQLLLLLPTFTIDQKALSSNMHRARERDWREQWCNETSNSIFFKRLKIPFFSAKYILKKVSIIKCDLKSFVLVYEEKKKLRQIENSNSFMTTTCRRRNIIILIVFAKRSSVQIDVTNTKRKYT